MIPDLDSSVAAELVEYLVNIMLCKYQIYIYFFGLLQFEDKLPKYKAPSNSLDFIVRKYTRIV